MTQFNTAFTTDSTSVKICKINYTTILHPFKETARKLKSANCEHTLTHYHVFHVPAAGDPRLFQYGVWKPE